MSYDFSGYATKNDLRCSDGRTIRRGAFKDCDGKTVPLVWQHIHNDPGNILGHALLEARDDGIYCYGSFNDSEKAEQAKGLLEHGDICSLSIYANRLVEKGGDVLHGVIREVSLVLTGANPGALIDNIAIQHSDGEIVDSEEDAIIYSPCELGEEESYIMHNDDIIDILVEAAKDGDDAEIPEEVLAALDDLDDDEIEDLLDAIEDSLPDDYEEDDDDDDDDYDDYDDDDDYDDNDDGGSMEHADSERTIGDIIKTMNEEQKQALYALIGMIVKENNLEHGGINMNVFENGGELMHSELDFGELIDYARYSGGSLADAYFAHSDGDDSPTYGIDGIDNFKPGATLVTKEPDFISRQTEWVSKVLNSVHRSPFSRIKTMYSNITADAARAKGYVTGNQKVSEVITALKRTTTPTTVYKLQKLDRDDILDITDFDVVVWIKAEMRMMLDEEIARAMLIGDGRTANDNDKINETNIRPVYSDDETYTIRQKIEFEAGMTNKQQADLIVEGALRSRENYLGKGTPTFYCTTQTLDTILLAQDLNGRRVYNSVADVAAALRCAAVVEVPVMSGLYRTDSTDNKRYDCDGIIVNFADYNMGADKGGNVELFDDFDIDVNQQKYLIETRVSGALVHPKSAIVIEHEHLS